MEHESRRGTPRPRAERPASERVTQKPTAADSWDARLMNAFRAEMRTARERQGITFDELERRCATLKYPISRVTLTKIEGGYRPDLRLPELLIICRALNLAPDVVLAPVARDIEVEVLPGVRLTPWNAALWLRGTSLPPAMADSLTPGGPDDGAEFTRNARVLGLYEEHAARIHEWLNVEYEARSLFKDDRDRLNYVAGRLQPIQVRLRDLRVECRTLGAPAPPAPYWMAAILDAPRTTPFTGYEFPQDMAAMGQADDH